MLTHFSAPAPRFGRVNKRLSISHQQRSPYYWWWAYLRRNEDYLSCCELGGVGEMAELYRDFGDVREEDFHKWWTADERGARLFGEKRLEVRLSELGSAAEWSASWQAAEVLVVAVPLRVSKRSLRAQFNKLLDERHMGKQGRPALAQQMSTARYPLTRNYTIANLSTMLAVYDLWLLNGSRSKEDKLTLWQIGCELRINPKAAKDAVSQFSHDRLVGRNNLGAAVSRYVKQAQGVIAGLGVGIFPAA